MKLFELFLNETTEEDRAIISLSSAIYNKLKDEYIGYEPDYTDEDQELIDLGKIGNMFKSSIPVLDNIGLELQGGEPFLRRANRLSQDDDVEMEKAAGVWDDDTHSVVLNLDYLTSNNIRSILTHEFRHALDEIKSDGYKVKSEKNANRKKRKGNEYGKYFVPKDKKNRKDDPYHPVRRNISYYAQPAEINARFTEVLDDLTTRLPNLLKRFGPDGAFDAAITSMNNLFKSHRIIDVYPEKDKSPDYKRLVKRGVDFIQKELQHLISQEQK